MPTGGIPYVRIATLRELIASVQGGTFEFHSWGSSFPRIDRPDRITLDLDPDPGAPVAHVPRGGRADARAARQPRARAGS